MRPTSRFSICRRLRSFQDAIRGVGYLVVSQHNAWIHGIATAAVLVLSMTLQIPAVEWCLIVLAIMSVWVTEALNTSLEVLTDLISPEFHPLAGKAKDIAAGAVLLAALGASAIGLIVFVPHLLRLTLP